MNQPVEAFMGSRLRLRELVTKAGSLARERDCPLIEALEACSGLAAGPFVAALGSALRYAVLDDARLDALEPAFDRLPYAEAVQHRCVLLRTPDGELVLAFADPFDERRRAWADERIPVVYAEALVHRTVLTEYYSADGRRSGQQ